VGSGGALGAGLDDEVLVGAGKAREPVQDLQQHDTGHQIPPGEHRYTAVRKGVARTGRLDAGDAGRKTEKVMAQPRAALWWRNRRLCPPNILVLLSFSSAAAAAGGGGVVDIAGIRLPVRWEMWTVSGGGW
jgi:hypothetical protein